MRKSPWITDGALSFIENFINSFVQKHDIFPNILEFGSGASTIYFAKKSSSIISFEHDEAWYQQVNELMPKHDCAKIFLHPRPYSKNIKDISEFGPFDIIIIDGRDRFQCLKECVNLNLLSSSGAYLLDNTERVLAKEEGYANMFSVLGDDFELNHFEQRGPDLTGWVAPHRWVTTIAQKTFIRNKTKRMDSNMI